MTQGNEQSHCHCMESSFSSSLLGKALAFSFSSAWEKALSGVCVAVEHFRSAPPCPRESGAPRSQLGAQQKGDLGPFRQCLDKHNPTSNPGTRARRRGGARAQSPALGRPPPLPKRGALELERAADPTGSKSARGSSRRVWATAGGSASQAAPLPVSHALGTAP